MTGLILLFLASLYLYFLWRTESFLDSLEQDQTKFKIPSLLFRKSGSPNNLTQHQLATASRRWTSSLNSTATDISSSASTSIPDRYLIFVPISAGQGTGNIISGLLAVHLLGLEFNRIVCVLPDYKAFLDAFEPIHPWVLEKCPQLLADGASPDKFGVDYIQVINFLSAPDECRLKTKLESNTRTLWLEANTYPRWPAIPPNFFFTYYRARPNLLALLPSRSPTASGTVVHLREPDSESDHRKGLDPDSLRALGKLLPRDTYLVTNRLEWYDYFEQQFGWSHPNWTSVQHSALRFTWGRRGGGTKKSAEVDSTLSDRHMWADWYVILTAQHVYHTHSDFSISAIHWMDIKDTHTILGYNPAKQQLDLIVESWRETGETARLVDRTVGGPGTSELRQCSAHWAKVQREREDANLTISLEGPK